MDEGLEKKEVLAAIVAGLSIAITSIVNTLEKNGLPEGSVLADLELVKARIEADLTLNREIMLAIVTDIINTLHLYQKRGVTPG